MLLSRQEGGRARPSGEGAAQYWLERSQPTVPQLCPLGALPPARGTARGTELALEKRWLVDQGQHSASLWHGGASRPTRLPGPAPNLYYRSDVMHRPGVPSTHRHQVEPHTSDFGDRQASELGSVPGLSLRKGKQASVLAENSSQNRRPGALDIWVSSARRCTHQQLRHLNRRWTGHTRHLLGAQLWLWPRDSLETEDKDASLGLAGVGARGNVPLSWQREAEEMELREEFPSAAFFST